MMCVFLFKIVIYSIISLGMISGQDHEEEQFGLNPLECYTEYKPDTRCELSLLWPIITIIMLMLPVASFFLAINALMMWKKLMWKNWQLQGSSNRRDDEYGGVLDGMGPRNKINQEVVKEVHQNADPEVDQKSNRNIDALQKTQSKAITTEEQLLIDTENLNNLMRCLTIADNSDSDDLKANNSIDEMLPIDSDIYAKEDDVSNIQEEDITYFSAEREDQNIEKSTSMKPKIIIINNMFFNKDNTSVTDGLMIYKHIHELVAQQIKSCAKSSTENKNTLKISELFVNKSLIQNSESDPEIVMKISNQSNYGQSVFSPKKDWSSGDSQENNARKILKSSQSDGTFDIDLAMNENLFSTSSQIFRAPRYSDSSNDSKLSLSGNCLNGSDISKISEKSVELFENKSLIRNSESDPEIVMKISNQSNYGQSVFSPEKDWSSGDSQENNARKILKSSQSDGTFDIDLAMNENLFSTSSQIFRAPRYSDSSNDSKLSLSGNCLNGSDISKISEKSVELFENKSLIRNSESDPEIVMKISNQSNYGQSVFSPEKDLSSRDAQENNARKILKSSQSDGTFDIDLPINDNLSSTSSQIFRAPRYNNSPNDSKPSLSGDCLIDSDIFKIPEKTSETSVDSIDIADEDFHPITPEKREAENSPDEIVKVVLYDPDGNPVIVNFRVLSDV